MPGGALTARYSESVPEVSVSEVKLPLRVLMNKPPTQIIGRNELA